ncbi:MAG TPA: hypothetical protein VL240_00705 [Candidatus Binatia bacterium]|nr:hypothetical protein [Candidatus Binatia bacterium]
MSPTRSLIRTEVRGLDLSLDGASLSLSLAGEDLIASVPLDSEAAGRLHLEMAKAQLWEWNQLEELKSRAELRYRRYLCAWLVMCLGAFSAYVGYPGYYLCIAFSLLSVFLWWRAGYEEQRAERAAQAQRNAFRPEWSYLRERLEESGADGPE